MRIVFDIDILAHKPKTGVYSYNQHLLTSLLKLDRHNDYTLSYLGHSKTPKRLGLPDDLGAAIQATSWFPRHLFNLSLRTPFGIPYDLITGTRGDVFVFAKFALWPLWRRSRSIVIVYDATFLDAPYSMATRHFQHYLAHATPRALAKASHIVTISEFTKARLVDYYGVKPDKLSVVTPAIDHDFFKPAPPADIKGILEKYGINQPYILSLGTLEPRKDLMTLLRALLAAPADFKQRHSLVLAGGKGWHNQAIEPLYRQLAEEMKVIRTGFVDNDDLPALYSGAEVFVFPSRYEGFGMPPLEAMACGTPVIVADNSSLPEVVETAGLRFPTGDPQALELTIQQLLNDPKQIKQLQDRGLKRAAQFSWDKSAKDFLGVITMLESK